MGRRKVEVEYRSNTPKGKQLKTFEVRRAGLFKKASQLSVLCGCKIAIQIESENGNVFEFQEDSKLGNGGDKVSTSSLALPAAVKKDETLSPSAEIPHSNGPFLEMGRDKSYIHDALAPLSMDFDSFVSHITFSVDCNDIKPIS